MNKFLKKISAVVQMVLLAPVKLPGQALNVIKYIALGLGILEAVVSDKGDDSEGSDTVKSDRVTSDDSEGSSDPEASSGRVSGEKEVNELSGDSRLDRDKQVNEEEP